MKLAEYVQRHVERGACMCAKCLDAPESPLERQPKGHTADLVFFKVRKDGRASREEFLRLVREEFPRWLDGNEHSYLETGSDMGDQGLALMTMGLGELLDAWKLLTPKAMIPLIPEEHARLLAGRGFVTIRAEPPPPARGDSVRTPRK